jgi:hypothetical protein
MPQKFGGEVAQKWSRQFDADQSVEGCRSISWIDWRISFALGGRMDRRDVLFWISIAWFAALFAATILALFII